MNIINKLERICFMLLLYIVTSIIIVSIIDYWFLYRFIHDGHYWFNGIPAETCPLLQFLLIRIHQDWKQSLFYMVFLLIISIINYTIINIELYDCKGKPNGTLTFLSKYFCMLLFTIINLRFFGDLSNYNVDKTGWYFLTVAVPTYIQLMAFCVAFYVILKNDKDVFYSNFVRSIPNNGGGKFIMYLSILYLTYYSTGCIMKSIYLRTDAYNKYFSLIGKPIKSIILKFCFSNGFVVSINIAILLITSCIYIYLIRAIKVRNNLSNNIGLYFIIKVFTIFLMFSATIRYWLDCLKPQNNYIYNMIINYIYWPLMITSILLLLILRCKNKKEN